jgi:hypothetical protein
MPALMGPRLVAFLCAVALGAAFLGACGKEIGDACVLSSDCSPNGDRQCIDSNSTNHGYCTVQGCDFSTCPDEATCIRFFTGSFANKACDPAKTADACSADPASCCSLDELCALEGATDEVKGHCVPRSSEVRYCMRTCGSNDDCRDGYECRDLAKMKAHGGQPVLDPGTMINADGQVVDAKGKTSDLPKFCALAPP